MDEAKTGRGSASDTLYNKVRNEILKIIIERQIGSNELLPSEGEIAELCNVSKMTSKLALNSLAEEHIIYRIPRRGSFLADVDLNKIRSMVDSNSTSNYSAVKSNYLALVIPKMDSYCGNIVRVILTAAEAYNYHVVVKYSDGISETEEQILSEISKVPEIMGVILFPGDNNTCGIELLSYKVHNYPIVIVDRVYKEVEFDSICHDNYQGAKDAVSYLIRKGHSKIGFISKSISNVTSREERYQGYMAAMMEGNKRIRLESVQTNDNMVLVSELKEYLINNDSLTAVFCSDDYIAVYLYYAAGELGKSVPGDLSIMGFTDNEILNFIPLKMTTVKQPVEELGTQAVEVLMDKIADSSRPPRTIRIKTDIIERDSVKEIKITQ
ncbi:LacI family transcriptional regulator [Anaerocolumna chitinilytica]|uniref:LacI family transcriptional regulator n=2 Tax=Anaerocolumna chitinilytica TaxID=1727145 RepID=A0A7I8DKR9_9FIRM|nr:LacI family transcriptional regulator [Anaerocolumna chitinilytica]